MTAAPLNNSYAKRLQRQKAKNAKRIRAAAPEMLNALKGLLHSIDYPADTDSAVDLERELRRIDDARAAIAKAEGRS